MLELDLNPIDIICPICNVLLMVATKRLEKGKIIAGFIVKASVSKLNSTEIRCMACTSILELPKGVRLK
jgi:hypothetical protein